MTHKPLPDDASRTGGSILIFLLVLALAGVMGWAGSQRGTTVRGLAVFAVSVGWIFLVQLIAFIPAWTNRTEKFFDLTGSLTYITTMIAGLFLSGNFDGTAVLITVAVVVWTGRLGSFLFTRVRRAGSGTRTTSVR